MNLLERLQLLSSKNITEHLHKLNFKDGKIIIDYCGPNIAKHMHMGHLRTTILGESLKRLISYVGFDVVGDLHYGDLSTQMGCLLIGLKEKYKNTSDGLKYLKENPNEIFEIQKDVALRAKSNKSLDIKARQEAIELQQLNGDYADIRNQISLISLNHIDKMLQFLNVRNEQYYGESRYVHYIDEVIKMFSSKELIKHHKGDIVVPLRDTHLFLKGHDGYLAYSSIDMGTIYDRVFNQGAKKIIYVMGHRQKLHWKQVFSSWEEYGLNVPLIHKSHGSVLEEREKPYKLDPYFGVTMESFLEDLVKFASTMTEKYFYTKHVEDFEKLSNFMALTMLKISDFAQPAEEAYIFNTPKNTGVNDYPGINTALQYSKIKKILENSQALKSDELEIEDQLQQDFASLLLDFPSVIEKCVHELELYFLCRHLLKIVNFWEKYNLSELRNSNLKLLELSKDQVETIFHIFAINVPSNVGRDLKNVPL
ncbi:MAG: arginine--tRNA ligase [Alphaproteobacteria bacterium 41-28]|nr:MAG: arginine--tRNA ligase [Alphaproteobacteria bacterium 41-28]